jgi:hypothetical protein
MLFVAPESQPQEFSILRKKVDWRQVPMRLIGVFAGMGARARGGEGCLWSQ